MASNIISSVIGEGGGLSRGSGTISLTIGASDILLRSLSISSSEGNRSGGATKSSSFGYGDAPSGARKPSLAAQTRA